MIVIGVGCGPGMLTQEAVRETSNARGSSHDKAAGEAIVKLKRGKIVVVIADPGFDVKSLAGYLGPDCRIAIREDLGYDSEQIETGTAASLPEARSRLFSLVVWRPEGGP